MASSYSSDLKLELMVTGENAGTWGDKTNTNLNLIQQAVAGFEQVTLSSGGTLALVMSDGAASNARNMVIKFATATIAASTVCTIPDSIEKFYIFDATGLTNPTNLTIKTASGSGFTLDQAKIYAAYSDGTNLKEISLDTLGGTVAAANISGTIATSQIADDAVTSAKIADDAVVTAAIADDAITSALIADDAVGADQLADTSVSAGSYTTANITVDAQGRLTAASSGAGGDGAFQPNLIVKGPASSNYTSPSNASKFYAYAFAGGGGAGGKGPTSQSGAGGTGGFGFFTGSLQASTTYAYNVGGGGSGGNQGSPTGGSGSAGGATNVGSLFTVNGGNGGQGGRQPAQNGSPGNAGSAPGAAQNLPSRAYLFGETLGDGGDRVPNNMSSGQTGSAGGLAFYDNGN